MEGINDFSKELKKPCNHFANFFFASISQDQIMSTRTETIANCTARKRLILKESQRMDHEIAIGEQRFAANTGEVQRALERNEEVSQPEETVRTRLGEHVRATVTSLVAYTELQRAIIPESSIECNRLSDYAQYMEDRVGDALLLKHTLIAISFI